MRHFALVGMISVVCLISMLAADARQPTHPPTVDLESMLDTFFNNDNGVMRFDQYVIGFAPEGGPDGKVVVMNEQRKVIAEFPFFSEFKNKEGVFARAGVQGPAEFTFSEAGVYNLIFVIGGKPVSRLPFGVSRLSEGDPLNPKTSFSLDGLWSQVGNLTMKTQGDVEVPVLSLWLGNRDLAAGASKDMFRASLYRGGELVAVSKKSLGHIAAGHYKRTTIELWHPHDDKQSQNAKSFTKADWVIDGSHELRITRQSDDAPLRSFKFEVTGGAIKPMPQTELTHEPAIEYILPRVARKNTNTFEMIEAIWLESK